MTRLWIFNHYAGLPEHVPAVRTFRLAKLLAQRGVDVTVVASSFNHYQLCHDWDLKRYGVAEIQRDGVRFVFVKTPGYRRNGARRLRDMLTYRRAVLRWGLAQPTVPDCIIGTTVHPWAADGARRLARRLRARFFYEITDLWPETLVDMGVVGRRHPIYRWMFRLEAKAYVDCHAVIGLLPGVQDYLQEFHGGNAKPFVYVPNGLGADDPILSQPAPAAQGQKVAVYVGGFIPAHGLDAVIDAARVLKQRGRTDIQLRLYGEGPERQRLINRCRREGLPQVSFPGWLPRTELPTVLREATMALCTGGKFSVHRFGTSTNKLFDYFAARLPVVYSVATSNDPVAASGGGIVVPLGNAEELAAAMAHLADLDVDKRLQMGERGKRFLEREHIFERLVDRVHELLEIAEAQDPLRESPKIAVGAYHGFSEQ